MVAPILLKRQSTEPLMDHLGVRGATMALMLTARGINRGSSSSGDGRGYAWQSDGTAERSFMVLQEALSRGHLALITDTEVDTMVIAVVAVGQTATANIHHPL